MKEELNWSRYGISPERQREFIEEVTDLPRGVLISDKWMCDRLGISYETLMKMVEAGEFPPPRANA